MYSARANTALPVLGFPIRESAGQRLFSSSPRLIAAVHALHRLLVPRHPPCALTILTVIVDSRRARAAAEAIALKRRFTTVIFRCCLANNAVFKVRRGRNRGASPAGLSKLSSTRPSEDDLARFGRHAKDAQRQRMPRDGLQF